MIQLDGSIYEGGGQILRTALALSALTKKPFVIKKIRKNRPEKGLKQQHLVAVNAIKDLCNADVKGNELKSEYLRFIPREIDYKNLNIDIKTAGSITLLLQALMPILIFSDKPIKVKIKGGTDVKHSPSIDYFTNVFLPFLKDYIEYDTELLKRGYYPKGEGEFILKIKPKYCLKKYPDFDDFHKFLMQQNKKIDPEKGNLIYIKGISHSSMDLMKNKVAERQAKFAKFVLKNYLINNKLKEKAEIKIQIYYNETLSTGSGITLWAQFNKEEKAFDTFKDNIKVLTLIGSDELGEKGKKAEIIGKECANNLIKELTSNNNVDSFMADQLLIYMSLFGGSLNCNISEHCKANMYAIMEFLGKRFSINNKNIIFS